MNILVTGATGFIGNALVQKLLKQKNMIRVLVRDPRVRIGSAEIFVGDVTNLESCKKACEGMEIVFHCAGVLGGWGTTDQKLWDVNVQGTRNMLEAAFQARVKKFVHISSCGIFGPLKKNKIADEKSEYNPTNTYEETKIEGERSVLSYVKKLPVIIIRPEFVYGPGDRHLLPLFKAVKEKRFVFFNDGKSTVHPTYIDDVVTGIVFAIKSKEGIGEAFNIAGSRTVTVKEFITEMACALGVAPSKISIPSPIPELVGTCLDCTWGLFSNPPLTLSQVRYLTENRASDWTKAKKILGYEPKTDLRTGMKNTVGWYRLNKLL